MLYNPINKMDLSEKVELKEYLKSLAVRSNLRKGHVLTAGDLETRSQLDVNRGK